jgi:RNA-directed DNA polymerase
VPAGRGLPLGGYLSHWSGGLYLDGLDHAIKRVLKVPGYLRYMDDFVLFADRAEALAEARERIGDWLARERGLALKDPLVKPLDNRLPAVFLGFRVSRAGVGPGPKALHRLRRRLRAADDLDPEQLARSLQAFRGICGALGG